MANSGQDLVDVLFLTTVSESQKLVRYGFVIYICGNW